MADRLVDVYAVGDKVEVLLNGEWLGGRIVAHDFPGIWVQTKRGAQWFVTNRRHVRAWVQKRDKE